MQARIPSELAGGMAPNAKAFNHAVTASGLSVSHRMPGPFSEPVSVPHEDSLGPGDRYLGGWDERTCVIRVRSARGRVGEGEPIGGRRGRASAR